MKNEIIKMLKKEIEEVKQYNLPQFTMGMMQAVKLIEMMKENE